VPSHTWPRPCAAPKPTPLTVTLDPGAALRGATLEMDVVSTTNGRALDQAPPMYNVTAILRPHEPRFRCRSSFAPSCMKETIR
jgi:hypothetical protein